MTKIMTKKMKINYRSKRNQTEYKKKREMMDLIKIWFLQIMDPGIAHFVIGQGVFMKGLINHS